MTVSSRSLLWVLVFGFLAAAGCVDSGDPGERLVVQRGQGLEAFCSISVQTVGLRDMETDYLPHVVACENGAADFEALKAHAVAARAYAYYRLDTGDGTIAPDTSDQAYLCSREPGPEHYEAVNQTAGQVLMYNNQLVAAFYVAGAIPSNRSSCVAQSGDNDYSSTERYVTYNQGRSGSGLEQTMLGWVDPRNDRNRGCKSQNGAHCLAEAGWDYRDILTFYYGSDIQLVQAEGACVGPVEPVSCGDPIAASGESVLDEDSSCFARGCQSGDWWWDHPEGYGGDAITTYTIDGESDCSGRWTLEFDAGGEYVLYVHLTDAAPLSAQAPYTVRHAGGDETVVLNQRGVNGWAELGTFAFTADGDHFVQLTDSTGEPYTGEGGTRIMFDALKVVPAGEQPVEEDTGVVGEDTGGGGEDTGGAPDSGMGGGADVGGGQDSGAMDAGGGGGSGSDASAATDAGDSASQDDAGDSESVASFNEGGCTASPGRSGRGGGLWLAALMLLGVVARRLRR